MSATNFECIEHVVSASYIRQYSRATASGNEDELKLAVKQYRPRSRQSQPGDVTILACHANGFPKELYEPLWDALLAYTERREANFKIRGIWIMDLVNQGDSGVLNAGKLGNEPSWHDFSRDYLNIVNHFRHDMPRPIVGFGHSLGGSVIMDLALIHPRLMTSVIAIEPSASGSQVGSSWSGAAAITFRRDRWASREAAKAGFRRSPLHGKWDQRVLDLYLQFGLVDLPAEPGKQEPAGVTLKTAKDQEALSFARASWPKAEVATPETLHFDRQRHPEAVGLPNAPGNPIYRPELTSIFQRLPTLRPSCLYIYGGSSVFSSALPEKREEKLHVTGVGMGGSGGAADGRVKELRVEGGSHWLAFETPDELGRSIGDWLDKEVKQWREVEAEDLQEWQSVPNGERAKVDDEWRHWMDKLFRKQGDREKKPTESKL